MLTDLRPDPARARQLAAALLTAYATGGVFGHQEMPEDTHPTGLTAGIEEHLRFITLTVAIDYQRSADQLWDAARATYEDSDTRYLFDPMAVANTGPLKVTADLHRNRLSKKPDQDARTWQTICTTLALHFDGRVEALLQHGNYDALRLLKVISNGGFPFLKGPKIGPLWVRMLHDNCGVKLSRIAEVPLPVDVHTAQASLQTGAVHTNGYRGPMGPVRESVQRAWREALSGQDTYPLRLDEPLWLLSKYGCRKTRTWPCECLSDCPVAQYCQQSRPWFDANTSQITDASECVIELRSRPGAPSEEVAAASNLALSRKSR